jgi:RNA polymerase sigma factor (sigma-70 family)
MQSKYSVGKSVNRGDEIAWTDERLVKECLKGSEQAWSALIDKYKGLIFSIPVRFGIGADGASEVFQDVCLSLLCELPNLRQPKALPAWLMRTAWHRCVRWKRQQGRYVELEPEAAAGSIADPPPMPEALAQEVEAEQILHEAMAGLSARCYQLVRMLFFEMPSVPYQEIAEKLGLAIGSIGFVRMRCLKKLQKLLLEKGFR